MVRCLPCAFMPCPMTLPGIASQLGLFPPIWMWLFFFFFVWLQQTLVISWCLCQRGNLCASSVLGVLEFPWGPTWEAVGSFVCSGPHSPKGQRCGLGIRCLSTTAGGCFSSHQGPTFLYGLGFLIKSTHRKGPLAWVFCKKMGTINGLI